jgi:hypothetical protein
MSDAPRYRQDDRLPCQELDGQAVIVVPAKSEMHVLDEVGTFLWTQLRKSRSTEDLAKSVCEEYDVGPDRAEQDVRAFVDTLVGKGLLIRE